MSETGSRYPCSKEGLKAQSCQLQTYQLNIHCGQDSRIGYMHRTIKFSI